MKNKSGVRFRKGAWSKATREETTRIYNRAYMKRHRRYQRAYNKAYRKGLPTPSVGDFR